MSVLEPLRALRHREVRASGLTAVFYNFGFFTLLAYTPLALGLGAHELGYVFFGWGLMLAVFAVFVAPLLSRRIGDVRGLGVALAGFTVAARADGRVARLADGAHRRRDRRRDVPRRHQHAHDADRHGVRPGRAAGRLGRVQLRALLRRRVAPFVAGKLAEHVSVAVAVLPRRGDDRGRRWSCCGSTATRSWRPGRRRRPRPTPARRPRRAGRPGAGATPAAAPMVVAVGGPTARQVSAMAVPLARARGSEVHVLHVVERDVVVGEDAVDLETAAEARGAARRLRRRAARVRRAGHRRAARTASARTPTSRDADPAARAEDLGAGLIVVGPDSRQTTIGAGVTARIAGHAPAHVIVVHPRAGALGRPLAGVAGPADPGDDLGRLEPGPLMMEVPRCSTTSSSRSTARRTPTAR